MYHGRQLLTDKMLSSHEWEKLGFEVKEDGIRRSPMNMFRYKGVTMERLKQALPELCSIGDDVAELLEVEGVYQDYIESHVKEINAYKGEDELPLPDDCDYKALQLTTEEAELLSLVRPSTLGQASRMPGVRPTTVVTLLRVAKQHERHRQQQAAGGQGNRNSPADK